MTIGWLPFWAWAWLLVLGAILGMKISQIVFVIVGSILLAFMMLAIANGFGGKWTVP